MYEQIAANKRKTVFLMAGFSGLVAAMAWLFAYSAGNRSMFAYVLFGAFLYTFFSYFIGSKAALALNGAKEITKKDNPRYWRIVENLSITEGLPMPKVYIIEDSGLNAFATGRNPKHAAVAATRGLLETMDDHELEGVMAHELGHVKNYDIRVSMIAFALAAVIGLIGDMLWRIRWYGDDDDSGSPLLLIMGIAAAIIAPFVALMIQMAISRRREYLADATGALTTRYPDGLASALEKIKAQGGTLRRQNTSTAHLFLANPLKGKGISHLFSTHPPLEDRIAKLRGMHLNG